MDPNASQYLTNGHTSTSTTLGLPSSAASSQLTAGVTKKSSSVGAADAGPGNVAGGSGSGALVPRVDLEPIYNALRAGVPIERWIQYKEAISSYLLGRSHLSELKKAMDGIIVGSKQRLHNQLLIGMWSNISRDPPPSEVAPFVLATNKAANALGGSGRGRGSGGEGGDVKIEARLKVEVMALAGRDRRRIKEVPDLSEIEETLPQMLLEYYESKQIKIPEPTPQQSTAANTLNNKTNWEAEVKARYNLPLAAETGEFPDMDQIRMRMLPICYEEGVIGGIGDNAAQFINTASEIFVKEIMSTVISRVRCNRPATVKTDGFKRKLENMSPDDAGITSQPNNTDTALSRKRLKLPNGNRKNIRPTATLRLPSKDLVGERKVLGMDDLRLSFALGDNFLTQLPLSLYKIMGGGVNMPEDYAAPSAPLKFNLAQHFAARNQPNFAKKKGNIGPGGSMVGPSWANGMLEHSTTFGAGRQTGVGPSGGMEVGMLLGVHEEYVDDGLGFEANLDINRVDVGWEYGGWEGGAKDDRQELGSLLDECLMVGM